MPVLAAALNADLPLNPYQQPSPAYLRHWTLRPGWGADLSELAESKRASGRVEGVRALQAVAAAGYNRPLVVNEDGFKGPPLSATGLPRLLAVGDSVTFGLGGWDWVRAAEEELARRGRMAEAINGGVEGYAIRNALAELPHFALVQPRLCVLVIGWNDIFADRGYWGTLLDTFALPKFTSQLSGMLRQVGQDKATQDKAARAMLLRDKSKNPDKDAADVRRYQGYRPKSLALYEALGDQLASGGCRIVVATLPGLYATAEVPSTQALRIGHLPEFTDNPYVLAQMSEGTNAGLRDLANRKGWTLIDLESWASSVLQPRTDYFSDSVHLTAEGLRLMGEEIARGLEPLLSPP